MQQPYHHCKRILSPETPRETLKKNYVSEQNLNIAIHDFSGRLTQNQYSSVLKTEQEHCNLWDL